MSQGQQLPVLLWPRKYDLDSVVWVLLPRGMLRVRNETIYAFVRGLDRGSFRRKMIWKQPAGFKRLMGKVDEYINEEDLKEIEWNCGSMIWSRRRRKALPQEEETCEGNHPRCQLCRLTRQSHWSCTKSHGYGLLVHWWAKRPSSIASFIEPTTTTQISTVHFKSRLKS